MTESLANQPSEWMPLYINWWLFGPPGTLKTRQRGVLFQLLCWSWLNGAALPGDYQTLARYAGESERWLKGKDGRAVLALLPTCSDGKRRNPDIAKLYEEAVARKKKFIDRAAKGAASRWPR